MRLEKALLVFNKDFREVIRNRQVLLPMLILPLILALLIPTLTVIAPEGINTGGNTDQLVETLINNLPANIKAKISTLSSVQQITYVLVVYFFAPFFLIIPVMVSNVIAVDSFAGEKERNTLEALLATPITDSELLFGKILVSFVPGMGITLISFILYTVVVDVLTYQSFGMLIMPTTSWVVMILTLAPMASLLGIGVTVIISARVRGFREAQQLSALMVVPILMLVFGQASGFLMLGSFVVVVLALGVGLVALVVFRFGIRLFHRENILTKAH